MTKKKIYKVTCSRVEYLACEFEVEADSFKDAEELAQKEDIKAADWTVCHAEEDRTVHRTEGG